LKSIIFFISALFFSTLLLAQKNRITFILAGMPTNDSIDYYLAGNINGWNPKDEKYKFKRDKDGTHYLMCYFDKGKVLQFKFTKGGWDKVECNKDGSDVNNRVLQTDTTKFLVSYIAGWKDKFIAPEKVHTASVHVIIADTAFYIPQLNRKRRIWIYLPHEYDKSVKRYPVMYLHDGQNLFDEAIAQFGEWGVDECLDSLIAIGKSPCIVVGIDNGGETRMNEYNPYEFTWKDSANTKTFTPQGNEYIDFLINTLKKYIDKNYRTLSSKENTVIAGSSMGGLISYYAALKFPQVFGKAGIFSPAFWTAPQINNFTDSFANKINGKFFFYMGEKEGGTYVADMNKIAEKLGENSNAMIYSIIDTKGIHSEVYWRKWFAEFYNWIMADGYNNVISIEE
jgi:metallo-beta-lactamase class B